MTKHYTSGGSGTAIAAAGFNLCDVSSVSALNALPAGMQGLVWLAVSGGNTAAFRAAVTPFIGNPKLFGFYLWDEPNPRADKPSWGTYIPPADLKAQSDWIHANVPGAKTFIVLMNLGSSNSPSYTGGYTQANTGIDLFGVDAYPIRAKSANLAEIDQTVAAVIASGIPASAIVPVYQTFGGGGWTSDMGDAFVVPTPTQLQAMFDRWAVVCPNPVFDYAYAWGSQNNDVALGTSPELQAVCLKHNTGAAPVPVPTPTPTPVPTSSPILLNGKVATQADVDALVASANKSAATIAAIKGLVA